MGSYFGRQDGPQIPPSWDDVPPPVGRASEAPQVPSPLGAAAQGATKGGVFACDGLGGNSRIMGGVVREDAEMVPPVVARRNLRPFPTSKKMREANKQI